MRLPSPIRRSHLYIGSTVALLFCGTVVWALVAADQVPARPAANVSAAVAFITLWMSLAAFVDDDSDGPRGRTVAQVPLC